MDVYALKRQKNVLHDKTEKRGYEIPFCQKRNEISTPIMPRAPIVRGWDFVVLTKTLKLTNQPDLGAGNTDKVYTLFI